MDIAKESPCPLMLGAGEFERFSKEADFVGTIVLVTSEGMVRRGVIDVLKTRFHGQMEVVTVQSNPTLERLEGLSKSLAGLSQVHLIALGGGSVLDAAKVLSIILHPNNRQASLTKILRNAAPFVEKRIPLIAIPTTSGTGAEVTPFATVWDTELQRKRSLASSCMEPDLIILDPDLTMSAPLEVTTFCAMDACSHALESLWNKRATSASISYAMMALGLFVDSFEKLMFNLQDRESRSKMQLASFWSGLAIRQTRTAIAHSISYPLTLRYGVPHGLACSFLLPQIINLVTKLDAWPMAVDQDLINRVKDILQKADLGKKVERYFDISQIKSLGEGLVTPGRSDNFVLPFELVFETVLQKQQ